MSRRRRDEPREPFRSCLDQYADIKAHRDRIREAEHWHGFDPYNPPTKDATPAAEVPLDRQLWQHYMAGSFTGGC